MAIGRSSFSPRSETLLPGGARSRFLSRLAAFIPGVVLAAIATAASFSLRQLPGLGVFSPIILAALVGILFANTVGVPPSASRGIGFCQRPLLRLAIVLLGFQLSVGQMLLIGAKGFAIVSLALVSTFAFTVLLARLIGVDRPLAELIAAGTSVCGASAIVATNAVLRAKDEDVAYAVAAATLLGTVAMLTLPLVAPALGLDQRAFGVWAGTSIHEVAQVVGATFQVGQEAGEVGAVAKLCRVALLAPLVISLGLLARRSGRRDAGRREIPWFVLTFLGVVGFNSLVEIPHEVKAVMAATTSLLMTVGLAATGLQTDVSALRSRGIRPLALAFSAFVFIAGLSLLLIKLAG